MSNGLASRAVSAAMLGALTLTACTSGTSDTSSQGLTVAVTTTVLGDVVQRLVGADGTVRVLMEPGQDPHAFAPTAQHAQQLRQADLVVANGLQLEEPLLDLLAAAEGDGVEVLRVAEHVDPVPFQTDERGDASSDPDHVDDHATGDAGEGHDHESGLDPHVWYDPLRMADAVTVIADRLGAVDDTIEDDVWRERGRVLAQELRGTHDEIAVLLAEIPDECRLLVTNHDSFGYLARRYDLTVIGTVVPGTSGTAEPSAREFAELIDTVERSGVPAIFAETTQPARLAETLAQEVGRDVEVVTLFTDALGPPGSGAETYEGMLLTNATRIADALGRC